MSLTCVKPAFTVNCLLIMAVVLLHNNRPSNLWHRAQHITHDSVSRGSNMIPNSVTAHLSAIAASHW